MPVQLQANFFVIRCPRFSLDVLMKLMQAPSLQQDELTKLMVQPEVQEALYLATPDFFYRLQHWHYKQDPKDKTLQTILKYMIRMSSRPTPFGLFAGVSTGSLATQTLLTPAHCAHDVRKTRLDMSYLMAVRSILPSLTERADAIKWQLNRTLLALGDGYHYIEPIEDGVTRKFKLSLAEQDEYLTKLVELADSPQTISQLKNALSEYFTECEADAFDDYLGELIHAQILLPVLPLAITCGQPDHHFTRIVVESGATELGNELSQVLAKVDEMDQLNAGSPSQYNELYRRLSGQVVPVKENRLFQTDLWRQMQDCKLSDNTCAELEAVILALVKLNRRRTSLFSDFMQKFSVRFEQRFVPLLQALDEEIGVSFSDEAGYESELLQDLSLAGRKAKRRGLQSGSIEKYLLKQAVQRNQSSVLHIKSAEVLAGVSSASLLAALPASFSSLISLYTDEAGADLIHLHGCDGPSGANWLGRFCHLNTELAALVRDYLQQDALMSPGVVQAEIVHLPEGRPGNVLSRPALRDYEIVLLGDSVLAESHQIQLDELMVYIEDGKVKLWCPRLDCQVLPRLTAAHNYSARSLGLYKFLCSLQHQYGQVPQFELPKSWQLQERQPRIQIDNVIVSELQWRIERSMLEALRESGAAWRSAWQKLTERYQLERFVCYADGDNVLTLDLHQPVMLELLLSETAGQIQVLLKEALSLKYQSRVSNAEGCFAHELLVPWFNRAAEPIQSHREYSQTAVSTEAERTLFPGSSWLCLKLYVSAGTAELLVSQILWPLINTLLDNHLIKQWFFIRYADPDWHIRLRFHGDPNTLLTSVLPQVSKSLEPWLLSKRIWRMEIVPYERELERYGGLAATKVAERIFMADSLYSCRVIDVMKQFGGRIRAVMALVAMDVYLDVFGYSNELKLRLVSDLRQSYGDEFGDDNPLRVRLGGKYRSMRGEIQLFARITHFVKSSEFSGECDALTTALLLPAIELRQQLQELVGEFVEKLQQERLTSQDAVVSSLLHMSCNRIFKSFGREQEFVCFDFLRRFYLGQSCKQ